MKPIRKIDTVNLHFMDTHLIWTPRYYGQLSLTLFLRKAPTFSLNLTHLIQTPVNKNNRHLFLAQSTESHRKSCNLTNADTYQLFIVKDLSFLKVKKKPLLHSMSISSEPYNSPGRMNCRHQTILASIGLCRERFCLMQ